LWINVKNDKLSLQVWDEKGFNFSYTVVTPAFKNACCRIHVYVISKEAMTYHSVNDPLEAVLISHDVIDAYTRKKRSIQGSSLPPLPTHVGGASRKLLMLTFKPLRRRRRMPLM